MDEHQQIVDEFLVEATETLDNLDQDLVALESDPSNKSTINKIFRAVHTLKGTCGFLAFTKLESITHVGENLLDSARAGRLQITQEVTTGLLKLIDATRKILANIEATRTEGEEDYSELRNLLVHLASQATAKSVPIELTQVVESSELAHAAAVPLETPPAIESPPPAQEPEFLASVLAEATPSTSVNVEKPADAKPAPGLVSSSEVDELERIFWAAKEEVEAAKPPASALPATTLPATELPATALLTTALLTTGEAPEACAAKPQLPSEEFSSLAATTPAAISSPEPTATAVIPCEATRGMTAKTTTPPPAEKPMTPTKESPGVEEDKKSALSDSSLRVDVALLDQLMNLVGELVLARNQILQFTKTQTNSEFVSTSQRLNLITSELQEQVMKTRMQPIANVWNKFPRVVRDVAHQCGKQVRIEMEGKETDLDKTIIEAIKDPLTHIVRNSVDHGIEKPDVRIANGKEAEGRLLLRAFHEGGHVIIEIADDGAGLNTDRIKSKAIERGLITAEKAAKMSEKELNSLIFLPGFSTAEQVTNLSGRGVGMDVVRSNIERIGGSTDLSSTFGKGTTLRIKIPLTLAIVPALIVSCGGERFAIPQVSLVELMRVEGSNIAKQVESIHGSKFYRLRGNLLPLVYLSEELRLKHDNSANLEKLNIVVVKAEERSFGLVVEVVHDTEEIVVKPLGKQLKQLSVFAGATIMGDGRIALILDVLGLARKARVVGEAAKRAAEQKKEVVDTSAASNRQTLLIVQTGKGTRAAVPLAAVHRLEEFPISSIERASGTEVVQYRGGILPLVDLPLLLTGSASIASGDGDQRQVVVYSTGRGVCGFVVDRILDIVEDHVNVQVGSARPGVKGSAIIQKQVTDMLDLDKIIESMPGFTSSSTVS